MGVVKMEKTYNGWANYETWNFMLWYGDDIFSQLEDMVENGDFEVNIDDVQDQIQGYIDLYEEIQTDQLQGFALDLLSHAFSAIDSYDIAKTVTIDLQEKFGKGDE